MKEVAEMKKSISKKSSPQKRGFEDSINRLEELIKEMEAPDVPLEQLLEKYAEGVGLIQNCRVWLNDAQSKIEEIRPK